MNQIGGSRTDTLVKLVLIFFISLLSFSVGTYVGKNVTESQYKLSSLESNLSGEDSEQASNGHEDLEMKEVATDEDISNLTEEFVNKKQVANEPKAKMERKVASQHEEKNKVEEHAEAAHAAHGEKEPAKKPGKEVSNAAHRVAAGKAPTELHEPTNPKPEGLPKEVASTTTGKWTIQIASYSKEDEAIRHTEELKAKGFSAYIVTAQVKGATWYRVSVGSFPTMSEAAGYKTELMKKANLTTAIVQKITQ